MNALKEVSPEEYNRFIHNVGGYKSLKLLSCITQIDGEQYHFHDECGNDNGKVVCSYGYLDGKEIFRLAEKQ